MRTLYPPARSFWRVEFCRVEKKRMARQPLSRAGKSHSRSSGCPITSSPRFAKYRGNTFLVSEYLMLGHKVGRAVITSWIDQHSGLMAIRLSLYLNFWPQRRIGPGSEVLVKAPSMACFPNGLPVLFKSVIVGPDRVWNYCEIDPMRKGDRGDGEVAKKVKKKNAVEGGKTGSLRKGGKRWERPEKKNKKAIRLDQKSGPEKLPWKL